MYLYRSVARDRKEEGGGHRREGKQTKLKQIYYKTVSFFFFFFIPLIAKFFLCDLIALLLRKIDFLT